MTYIKLEKKIKSSDQKNTLSGVVYVPSDDIRGIFHLVHGMTEYIGRYEPLFESLAGEGYLCCGFDNLGHGNTANEQDLGFIASKIGWSYMVDDVKLFADSIKSDYPNVPYILMGHSMGSFIVRLAAERYVKPTKLIIFDIYENNAYDIQQELKKNKYVKSYRLGVYGEGEDGVTIAEFR